MLKFVPFEEVDPSIFGEPEPPRRLPSVQCYCGRFAKNLGTRHHYNGTWTLITTTVRCSKCGDVSVEHV